MRQKRITGSAPPRLDGATYPDLRAEPARGECSISVRARPRRFQRRSPCHHPEAHPVLSAAVAVRIGCNQRDDAGARWSPPTVTQTVVIGISNVHMGGRQRSPPGTSGTATSKDAAAEHWPILYPLVRISGTAFRATGTRRLGVEALCDPAKVGPAHPHSPKVAGTSAGRRKTSTCSAGHHRPDKSGTASEEARCVRPRPTGPDNMQPWRRLTPIERPPALRRTASSLSVATTRAHTQGAVPRL